VTRRGTWLLVGIAFLLLIPFMVPVPENLERMRGLRSLGVLAHFTLPGVLAVFLYHRGCWRGSILKAGAAAFIFSALTEFVQAYVGRHPRFLDALVDLAGVVTACGWLLYRRSNGVLAWTCIVLGMCIIPAKLYTVPGLLLAERLAEQRFPLIADFETQKEMWLWDHNDQGHGHYSRWADTTDDSMVLKLIGADHHYYPGILARGLPRDWSSFEYFCFRVKLLDGSACGLGVRLDDFASRKDSVAVERSFRLERHWQEHRIDLADLAISSERPLRLDDIDSLLLYLFDVTGEVTVLIDDIVLE
jgi:VanZ family protein